MSEREVIATEYYREFRDCMILRYYGGEPPRTLPVEPGNRSVWETLRRHVGPTDHLVWWVGDLLRRRRKDRFALIVGLEPGANERVMEVERSKHFYLSWPDVETQCTNFFPEILGDSQIRVEGLTYFWRAARLTAAAFGRQIDRSTSRDALVDWLDASIVAADLWPLRLREHRLPNGLERTMRREDRIGMCLRLIEAARPAFAVFTGEMEAFCAACPDATLHPLLSSSPRLVRASFQGLTTPIYLTYHLSAARRTYSDDEWAVVERALAADVRPFLKLPEPVPPRRRRRHAAPRG